MSTTRPEEPGEDGEDLGTDLRGRRRPGAPPEWGPGAAGTNIKTIQQPKDDGGEDDGELDITMKELNDDYKIFARGTRDLNHGARGSS
eukprot:10618940-Heterocapsa_arctica.AAC.1